MPARLKVGGRNHDPDSFQKYSHLTNCLAISVKTELVSHLQNCIIALLLMNL